MSTGITRNGGLGSKPAPMSFDDFLAKDPSAAEANLWVKSPSRLPQAPHGFLFPVVAFEIAGRALLGDAGWTGTEMRVASIQYVPLPKLEEAAFAPDAIDDTKKRYQMHLILGQALLREFGAGGGPSFNKENWEKARQEAPRHTAEWERAKARRDLVISFLGRCAEAGFIRTVYRPKGGGEEPREIPRAWWGLDDFLPRYRACGVDPKNPTRTGGALPAWFFLHEANLREMVAPPAEGAASSPVLQDGHVSDYIKIMIDAARASGIGPEPERQLPKKQLFKVLMKVAGHYGLSLSQNDMDAMATFIREPALKAGGPTVMAQKKRDEAAGRRPPSENPAK